MAKVESGDNVIESKFGRKVSLPLLGLIVLAIVVFCVGYIWQHAIALILTGAALFGAFLGEVINRFLPTQVRRRYREEILNSLALLRTEGVRLRNEGLAIADQAAVQPWLNAAAKWTQAVAEQASKLAKHEGELIRTLNVVQVLATAAIDIDLHRSLQNLDERIRRLERLIEDYRGKR